jgi:hypothetical protein
MTTAQLEANHDAAEQPDDNTDATGNHGGQEAGNQQAGKPVPGWLGIPPEIAERMTPAVDYAAEKMITAVIDGVPEYARPGDAVYLDTIRRATKQAVVHFVERIAKSKADSSPLGLYYDIGRMEASCGRGLETFQTAVRLASRTAWRLIYEYSGQDYVHPDDLAKIAEAVFAYQEELVASAVTGFEHQRAQVAGERERRRRRLLDLVIADPPASPKAVANLARSAEWPLPKQVAAIALRSRSATHNGEPGLALPPDALIYLDTPEPLALVPDPSGPGRQEQIVRGVRGWHAAIGPTVALNAASRSLRWARAALALNERGVLPGRNGVVRCAEHFATLAVFADEELANAIAAERLAPLADLRKDQQDRAAETLLAWLEEAGSARNAAKRLHIHPQTVRYRLRQIEELFGASTLAEPSLRFELEIALRVRLGRKAATAQRKR